MYYMSRSATAQLHSVAEMGVTTGGTIYRDGRTLGLSRNSPYLFSPSTLFTLSGVAQDICPVMAEKDMPQSAALTQQHSVLS